jgi:hypothetical protein
VISEGIEPMEKIFYTLPGLKQGVMLYVYVKGISGNLDPFVALIKPDVDVTTLEETFEAEVDKLIEAGRDPLKAYEEIIDKLALIWDDDSGVGYAAAFKFKIPADGDYHLLVVSSLAEQTFGSYRLLIGLDTPKVLTGEAEPTGDTIAVFNRMASLGGAAVQEVTGSLSEEEISTYYNLNPVNAGATLYAFAGTTSGNLKPVILLEDFGGKPLRSANFSAEQSGAAFEYTFGSNAINHRLTISAGRDNGTITTGDYRLLVGINAPEVLTGNAMNRGLSVFRQPTQVKIGLKMQQITHVDQKTENFGVVATLQMEWRDPNLAFSPDTCQCRFMVFKGDSFNTFIAEKGITWPEFKIFNQQGNRWSQNRFGAVYSDGKVIYYEHFSVTLQAPDFDFRKFPFDHQRFFIHVDSVFSEVYYIFAPLEDFTEVGERLGEEEWIVTRFGGSFNSEIADVEEGNSRSRFTFRFEARRHLNYYVFRIFLPILIILTVSWFTFFLRDYGKRVDVASGNLLVFIAFNFTISNDLPRLGYTTFMDTILVCAFVVTSLVLIFNVTLKRLDVDGKKAFVQHVDRYLIWLYPLAYILGVFVVRIFFH